MNESLRFHVSAIFIIAKINLFVLLLINLSCTSSNSSSEALKPLVEYDSISSSIVITQRDTAAHDTAYISISSIDYYDEFAINNQRYISIDHIIKQKNSIELAYQLAKNNYVLNVQVGTTRTNDTIFKYTFKNKIIKPLNVVKILSNNCLGLYDVNSNRDYHKEIRKWIFSNNLHPDSTIIERTNSLLCQLNNSEKKLYGTYRGTVPIVSDLKRTKFRFKAQLPGNFFYLYAYNCSSNYENFIDSHIKSFVETKVAEGLIDANHSVDDVFLCSNDADRGVHVLLLVGIDKNWNHKILPVGVIIVDKIGPRINLCKYSKKTKGRSLYDVLSNQSSNDIFSSERLSQNNNIDINSFIMCHSKYYSYQNTIEYKRQNIKVILPGKIKNPSPFVQIKYGDFDHSCRLCNIPFYIYIDGDIKSVTIQSNKLDAASIVNGACTRLLIGDIHVGDNSIPVSVMDTKGNKVSDILSIPVEDKYIYYNDNYYDYDFDELEERLNDLEDRLDNIE